MLKFLVYNPNDDYDESLPETAMGIEDFLRQKPAWTPALEDIFLVFDLFSESLNVDSNPFGVIDFILPQFIEAENRLREGKFAILRSTGDWRAAFYIFEPKKEITLFSLLGALPNPFSSYYPLIKSSMYIKGNINQRSELYNYIELNRTHLQPDNSFCTSRKMIQNIAFPTKELLSDLIHQAELGKALIKYVKNRS